MKEYVEGNYSADHQLSDDDRNNSRLWKYYEGIRKASTFIDNVDRCPELTMDEKTDLKGQARFLRAYCYWALIRVYGPVPLIPTEGLDVNLSYEELSLPREPFDNVVDFIDAELAETARSLPTKGQSTIWDVPPVVRIRASCQSFALCCQSAFQWKYRPF